MSIAENLRRIKASLPPDVKLVAISKTKPVEIVMEAYAAGQKIFGENRVQELVPKYEAMPKDIQWHLVGHLQSNKVKYIAPFVSLIHSADSLELLLEIDKQAAKNGRIIDCLLQVYIAQEDTKFGLSMDEASALLMDPKFQQLQQICIKGVMGMATNTENMDQVRKEFSSLRTFFEEIKKSPLPNCKAEILSMGMSSDYLMAVEEGSTMVRVGSTIFGGR